MGVKFGRLLAVTLGDDLFVRALRFACREALALVAWVKGACTSASVLVMRLVGGCTGSCRGSGGADGRMHVVMQESASMLATWFVTRVVVLGLVRKGDAEPWKSIRHHTSHQEGVGQG